MDGDQRARSPTDILDATEPPVKPLQRFCPYCSTWNNYAPRSDTAPLLRSDVMVLRCDIAHVVVLWEQADAGLQGCAEPGGSSRNHLVPMAPDGVTSAGSHLATHTRRNWPIRCSSSTRVPVVYPAHTSFAELYGKGTPAQGVLTDVDRPVPSGGRSEHLDAADLGRSRAKPVDPGRGRGAQHQLISRGGAVRELASPPWSTLGGQCPPGCAGQSGTLLSQRGAIPQSPPGCSTWNNHTEVPSNTSVDRPPCGNARAPRKQHRTFAKSFQDGIATSLASVGTVEPHAEFGERTVGPSLVGHCRKVGWLAHDQHPAGAQERPRALGCHCGWTKGPRYHGVEATPVLNATRQFLRAPSHHPDPLLDRWIHPRQAFRCVLEELRASTGCINQRHAQITTVDQQRQARNPSASAEIENGGLLRNGFGEAERVAQVRVQRPRSEKADRSRSLQDLIQAGGQLRGHLRERSGPR